MTHLSEVEIVSLVRRTLNEAQINESEFYSGADETEIDNLIKSRILEALQFVNSTADSSILEPDKVDTSVSSTRKVGDWICGIVLTPDFLRVRSIRVEGWTKALTEVIYDDDAAYQMQSDPLACGTPDNPIAYASEDLAGMKTIELYTLPSADSRIRVEYMVVPSKVSDTDGGIDVSDRVKDSYVYYLSFLVLTVLNDQHADDFLNMSMSLMGAQPKQQEGGAS